jgi:hypothetical protein
MADDAADDDVRDDVLTDGEAELLGVRDGEHSEIAALAGVDRATAGGL